MTLFKGIEFAFSSPENVKANILILHGICEHTQRYCKFTQSLSEQGYSTAAIDHLGHGLNLHSSAHFKSQIDTYKSLPPQQELLSSFDKASQEHRLEFQAEFTRCNRSLNIEEIIQYQQDFLRHLYQEKYFSEKLPLILIGQSMGGLLASELSHRLTSSQIPLKAVILLSPAFKPIATKNPGTINQLLFKLEKAFLQKTWNAYSGKSRLFKNTILKLLLKINPNVDSGRVKNAISDVAIINEIFTKDPMIGRNISLRFLDSILQLMVSNQQKAVGFPIPYLIMYATNDRIVDSQGSEGFSTRNHSSQKAFTSSQAYCYKDFAPHELHNSSLKEDTYKKIFSWLKARVEADAQ